MKERLEELIRDMRCAGLTQTECAIEFKKLWVIQALKGNRGNQCRVAEELHMHRNSLRRITERLGIDPRDYRQGKRKSPTHECGSLREVASA